MISQLQTSKAARSRRGCVTQFWLCIYFLRRLTKAVNRFVKAILLHITDKPIVMTSKYLSHNDI